ncbi:MAG: SDR family oxidoreductase [Bacteroidetes bacterium]|jgi:3-oxoacyl-[acyl-carrier protein] reductase|nr:SDR family oxidoreductase [Bacteroidota bacterium]MBT6685623.1 SDR family oxidoreductase [Bacteroidota bacterium]MBT7144698.1 SDR family oxidoreductase [Bacteroidota bacterium]MBT7491819.1 SDR family oxidoreductase [Bacteroidota bacterium]
MNFNGKNILITGGSRGIGKACAIAFSRLGAKVAINYKSDKKAAEQTLSEMEGDDHFAIKADVSKDKDLQKLFSEYESQFEKIDILVNNAGIYKYHPIDEVDFSEWKKLWKETIDVNLIASANLCFWASQKMIKNGGGKIVNVSSRGAFRGEPKNPAYGASKAGLNSMSQSLAKALAKYRIFVGVVAPGFVDTDMGNTALSESEKMKLIEELPMKRMATAEEVAHAVLFLASDGAEYTTGTIIDVNGASYLRT